MHSSDTKTFRIRIRTKPHSGNDKKRKLLQRKKARSAKYTMQTWQPVQ